ncbi:hypothetical protein BJ912DRAFT_1096819 [Pholiota molesta]|nr:hypothetical protein BJ912DRAFT_1096819 [Pholiota molesta]
MPVPHAKQVRFAYKNTFHSPPATPAMPPLTFSSSTPPSSLGVITPPTTVYPLATPPSAPHKGYNSPPTPGYAGSPRLHPYLDVAGISWDLLDHPSMISRHHQSISSRAWKEPATTPPLPFMTITVSSFPWKFNVHASNRVYVTFEDVVETIYRSLRKIVTEAEFHSAASPTDQRRVSRAYEQRYRRQRSTKLYEEEKRGGLKRVDFLMERTRFVALSNHSRRSDEWHLNVT